MLEPSQAWTPHFCHIRSQQEFQGQPQFKGKKESPPLLDRAAESHGKGQGYSEGPSL